MSDSWSVIMNTDKTRGIIPDDVRQSLKLCACRMHLKGQETMRMSTNVLAGVLKTDGETFRVGFCSGVLFKAQIDTGAGEFKVNFLLNTDDLERGAAIIREIEEEGTDGTVWKKLKAPAGLEFLQEFEDLGHREHRVLN